jgi:hypothetical protein
MAEAFAADPTLRAVTCAYRLVDAASNLIPSRPADLRTRVFEHGRGRRIRSPALLDRGRAPPIIAASTMSSALAARCGRGGRRLRLPPLLLGRTQYYGEVLIDYRMHGGNICNYEVKEFGRGGPRRRQICSSEAVAKFDVQWRRDLDVAFAAGHIDARRRAHIAWR